METRRLLTVREATEIDHHSVHPFSSNYLLELLVYFTEPAKGQTERGDENLEMNLGLACCIDLTCQTECFSSQLDLFHGEPIDRSEKGDQFSENLEGEWMNLLSITSNVRYSTARHASW